MPSTSPYYPHPGSLGVLGHQLLYREGLASRAGYLVAGRGRKAERGHLDLPVELTIPQSRGEIAALVEEKGHVLERKYEDGSIVLTAELDRPVAARLRDFVKERK